MFVLGLMIIYINVYIPKEPNDFYTKTFSFSINSLGAALLLAKADGFKNPRYIFTGKLITFISTISYSIYLVNLALVAQLLEKNFHPHTKFENALIYMVYWIATIVISTIIYKFFQKPIIDTSHNKLLMSIFRNYSVKKLILIPVNGFMGRFKRKK